jgi:hypothetical protein
LAVPPALVQGPVQVQIIVHFPFEELMIPISSLMHNPAILHSLIPIIIESRGTS